MRKCKECGHEVEEPKSLGDKLADHLKKFGMCPSKITKQELEEIARDHTLEIFDKSVQNIGYSSMEGLKAIRRDLEKI